MAATKVRPRTKPPETRRTELMDAAQRLFLEHGVGPTTIEQITAGAAAMAVPQVLLVRNCAN